MNPTVSQRPQFTDNFGLDRGSCKNAFVIPNKIVCFGTKNTKQFNNHEVNHIYFVADGRIIEGHCIAETYDISWSYKKVDDSLNIKIHKAILNEE
jgi:hypothetical protein